VTDWHCIGLSHWLALTARNATSPPLLMMLM